MQLQEEREVLVGAEDVEGDALNLDFLSRNLGGSKQVCAIKGPGFGENRRTNLEDLAILTGGEVIYKYPTRGNVNMEMFGTAKKTFLKVKAEDMGGIRWGHRHLTPIHTETGLRLPPLLIKADLPLRVPRWLPKGAFGSEVSEVIVSVDDTIILHGGGDKKLIEARCEQLRTAMEKSDTMFEREKARERLSNPSDVAVL
ncbi:hypothetical protein Ddye_024815 [Dipteronia dyeriana]|uniref:Uncharacterized protein n=1 Tax=Dipteronia dyeriana TaxID=168575 RepID=A0AAD9WUL7_9ROSI|nr:hypothetical protein Ddye_024815 [Dipteronia dyeriana]